jgi:hypothetical protein
MSLQFGRNSFDTARHREPRRGCGSRLATGNLCRPDRDGPAPRRPPQREGEPIRPAQHFRLRLFIYKGRQSADIFCNPKHMKILRRISHMRPCATHASLDTLRRNRSACATAASLHSFSLAWDRGPRKSELPENVENCRDPHPSVRVSIPKMPTRSISASAFEDSGRHSSLRGAGIML